MSSAFQIEKEERAERARNRPEVVFGPPFPAAWTLNLKTGAQVAEAMRRLENLTGIHQRGLASLLRVHPSRVNNALNGRLSRLGSAAESEMVMLFEDPWYREASCLSVALHATEPVGDDLDSTISIEQLRWWKGNFNLSQKSIAEITGSSVGTVKNWLYSGIAVPYYSARAIKEWDGCTLDAKQTAKDDFPLGSIGPKLRADFGIRNYPDYYPPKVLFGLYDYDPRKMQRVFNHCHKDLGGLLESIYTTYVSMIQYYKGKHKQNLDQLYLRFKTQREQTEEMLNALYLQVPEDHREPASSPHAVFEDEHDFTLDVSSRYYVPPPKPAADWWEVAAPKKRRFEGDDAAATAIINEWFPGWS